MSNLLQMTFHPEARLFKALNIVDAMQRYADDLDIGSDLIQAALDNPEDERSKRVIDEATKGFPKRTPDYVPSKETMDLAAKIHRRYLITKV